jgi:hypothetical protein
LEKEILELFKTHARIFNEALAERFDAAASQALFAEAFIAASPHGVVAGKNDAEAVEAMHEGYAHYRAAGAQEMSVLNVNVTAMDDLHAMARVDWSARYKRKDASEVTINFPVTYLVQMQSGQPKIFGWVSGDEEALLKEHGIG